MNETRLKTMLGYLPCKASAIPLPYRDLRAAEQEGLAVAVQQPDGSYLWTVTGKGKAFLAGDLKAPKARRFSS